MTSCDKTTSITELPVCTNVHDDSYLIVQNESSTCKVKISDLVLGPNNVDFYPDLIDILNKLDELSSIIEANSGKWNEASTTTQTNSGLWDDASQYNLASMSNTLATGAPSWNNTTATMIGNSAKWDQTSNTVTLSSEQWERAKDIVFTSQSDWDQAYVITLDGIQSIHEALEIIETSPWFTLYYDNNGAPPIAALWSLYTTVSGNSGNWDATYTTVSGNSGNWE
jgi:hypothetical protein